MSAVWNFPRAREQGEIKMNAESYPDDPPIMWLKKYRRSRKK